MDRDEKLAVREAMRHILVFGEFTVRETLNEFGWLELREAYPQEALALAFELQGECLGASPAINDVMSAPFRSDDKLPAPNVILVSGRDQSCRLTDSGLVMDGFCYVDTSSQTWLVPVSTREGDLIVRAEVDPSRLGLSAAMPLDPSSGLQRVQADVGLRDVAPLTQAGAPDVDVMIGLGRRALAHQILGGCQAMLLLARSHAVEREQFGRAIGGYQAVKHKLAETLVAVRAAEAAAAGAAESADSRSAVLAKLLANEAAAVAAKHCQQVLAGMGFTWEHPFHRYLKRNLGLQQVLGTTRQLRAEVGGWLFEEHAAPRLLELAPIPPAGQPRPRASAA